VSEHDTAAERPPQGITIRYMATGNARRDLLAIGPNTTIPRVDPDCLPEETYLALPIEGRPGTARVRVFNRATAAEVLANEQFPSKARGVRLATDAEVAAYQAEHAARSAKLKADREARERAEVARLEAEQRRRRGE
jgi:hypothetical protein